MKNLTKVLIGVGVVGAVAATTYFVTKSTVVTKENEEGKTVVEEIKEESILDQIKEAATKKAIKILGWVALHQQQIEAVGTILGLGVTVFSLVNTLRDFKEGNEMREKIDRLVTAEEAFREAWNAACDVEISDTATIMSKLNDIHLDMSYFHEQVENLPRKVTKKTA